VGEGLDGRLPPREVRFINPWRRPTLSNSARLSLALRERVGVREVPAVVKPKLPEQVREFARSLRLHQTDAEILLWLLLKNRSLGFKFRRQHPVGRYVLDLYCHEAHLCVEVDGGQHNSEVSRDEQRTAELNKAGIRVIRFWDNEVLNSTEAVLERIYLELTGSGGRG